MSTIKSAPTPKAFATAWTERFARVLREEAGRDGRVTLGTAARIAARADDDATFGDDLKAALTTRGQKSISVDKLLREIPAEVEAAAAAIAGPNQRISLDEGRKLPSTLVRDFYLLRGKAGVEAAPSGTTGAPLAGAALVAAAKHMVLAALDSDTAQKLASPPWVVRGVREIVDHLPHAASDTAVTIYAAGGRVFASRSSTTPSPLVGWYDCGPIPVALDLTSTLRRGLGEMFGVGVDPRLRYVTPGDPPTATFDLGPATARAKVAGDALSDVELLTTQQNVDPALKASTQGALRAGGHPQAFVRACVSTSNGAAVMYREGGATKTALVDGATVKSWTFDDATARALALQAAKDEAVLLASQVGGAAILEAIARTFPRQAMDLEEVVDPSESAVGLDPAKESQYGMSSVWGDNAVFVTFDRAAGTARVETFN